MQGISTTLAPHGSSNETKATTVAENNARIKIMSDEKFKNIFKFTLFMFEAACKNSELFSGKFSFIKVKYFIVDSIFCVTVIVLELKTKTRKGECGRHVYINNFSGGTINKRK